MLDVERSTFASGAAFAIFRVPMNLLISLLLWLFVLVSVIMVLVILMQRPKSEGLGAAFGGGVTENIFGAQTTNVLVKFTTWLAGIFFALTFGLSVLYAHRGIGGESTFRRELMKQEAAPATSPAGATPQASAGVSLKRTGKTAVRSSYFPAAVWKPPLFLHAATKFAELLLLRHTPVTIGS